MVSFKKYLLIFPIILIAFVAVGTSIYLQRTKNVSPTKSHAQTQPLQGKVYSQNYPDRYVSGWAVDLDNPNNNIWVEYYGDKPIEQGGVFLGQTQTSQPSTDINGYFNITGNHSFGLQIPPGYSTSTPHQIYLYAVKTPGDIASRAQLEGSPITQQPITHFCTDPAVNQNTCDTLIKKSFDGADISLVLEKREAGAIGSLRWKNQEFVQSGGHGSGWGYIAHVNGLGECYNPTEEGSLLDDDITRLPITGNSSSIYLEGLLSDTSINTKNKMAFWIPPYTIYPQYNSSVLDCHKPTSNTTLLSNYILSKKVTLGWNNLPNVLSFEASLEIPESVISIGIEHVFYLPYDFHNSGTFNPKTGLYQPIVDTNNRTYLPIIHATENGAFAIGTYTPKTLNTNEELFYNYVLGKPYISPENAAIETTDYHNFYTSFPAHTTLNFSSYAVIGDLQTVKTTLTELYRQLPAETIFGYQDTADQTACSIWGWAVDGYDPGASISVEVWKGNSSQPQTKIGAFAANQASTDVNTQYGVTGNHRFSIFFDQNSGFFDSNPQWVYIYGIHDGQKKLLNKSPRQLNCTSSQTPTLSLGFKMQGINIAGITKTVDVILKDSSGQSQTYSTNMVSDANGVMKPANPISLTNLTIGTSSFDVFIKDGSHLKKKLGTMTLTNGVNTAPLSWNNMTSLAGDFNNDNKLNILDIGLILSQYTALSTPATDLTKKYDVNSDNVINIIDIGVVLSNYTALTVSGDSDTGSSERELTFAPLISSNCHAFAVAAPQWFTPPEGNCVNQAGQNWKMWLFSSTNENKFFSGGTMYDISPTDPAWKHEFHLKDDGTYQVGMVLDKINFGQSYKNKYSFVGFNDGIDRNTFITLDKSVYLKLRFGIFAQELTTDTEPEVGEAKSDTGIGIVAKSIDQKHTYYMAVNFLKSANYDLCTQENLGGEGIPTPCDSTNLYDRRTVYTDGDKTGEIVLFNGPELSNQLNIPFPNFSVDQQLHEVELPITTLFKAAPWINPPTSWNDVQIVGFYAGTEIWGKGRMWIEFDNYQLFEK